MAAWPGLVWKVWIAEPSWSVFGGVYLFADEASAVAYLEGPIVEGIRAIPGVSEFKVERFEVNEKLSKITRGLLVKP
ncbi:MAG: YdhR family protein [Cyanobacteria bacterium P01_D01_bin.128]